MDCSLDIAFGTRDVMVAKVPMRVLFPGVVGGVSNSGPVYVCHVMSPRRDRALGHLFEFDLQGAVIMLYGFVGCEICTSAH